MTVVKHPKQTENIQHTRRLKNTQEKLVRSPERNRHTLTIKNGTSPTDNSMWYDPHEDRKTKNTQALQEHVLGPKPQTHLWWL
jgi:hypothetical protein